MYLKAESCLQLDFSFNTNKLSMKLLNRELHLILICITMFVNKSVVLMDSLWLLDFRLFNLKVISNSV